jgi:hypothetical protein
VPQIYPFFNQEVFFDGLCSGGNTPSFTGALPNWIILDAANNRLIGKAGVIGGQTQTQANANAQLALNQFAQAAIAAGEITCGSSLVVMTDDETDGGIISGQNNNVKQIGADLFLSTNTGVFSSSDGLFWNQLVVARSRGVDFNGSIYVTSTQGAVTSAQVKTSPDGISWTLRTVATPVTVGDEGDVLWDGAKFIFSNTDGSFYTSPDGINWTLTQASLGGLFTLAAWPIRKLNGKYFAVMNGAGLLTSANGSTWSSADDPGDTNIIDIAFGNGIYMTSNTDGKVYTSPDGHTWTLKSAPAGGTLGGLAFANGQFALCNGKNTSYSTDGTSWTDDSRQALFNLRLASHFSGKFEVFEN